MDLSHLMLLILCSLYILRSELFVIRRIFNTARPCENCDEVARSEEDLKAHYMI